MSRFDDIAYRQAEREYLSPPEVDPEVEQLYECMAELIDQKNRIEEELSAIQDRIDEMAF